MGIRDALHRGGVIGATHVSKTAEVCDLGWLLGGVGGGGCGVGRGVGGGVEIVEGEGR